MKYFLYILYMENKSVINVYNNTTELWCRQNSICREKVELFHDVVTTLIYKIEETYLGNDVINTFEDITNHFKWCWDHTIDLYSKENINFNKDGDHYRYFSFFFISTFYVKDTYKNMLSSIALNFVEIFHIDNYKTETELQQLKLIYDLLNNNIK